jgi:hypothetical protein
MTGIHCVPIQDNYVKILRKELQLKLRIIRRLFGNVTVRSGVGNLKDYGDDSSKANILDDFFFNSVFTKGNTDTIPKLVINATVTFSAGPVKKMLFHGIVEYLYLG